MHPHQEENTIENFGKNKEILEIKISGEIWKMDRI